MNPSRIAHMVANTLPFYFVADKNISYILLMGKSIHQCCPNQGHNREIHLGLTTFSQIMTKHWIRMRSILRLTHSKMIPFNTQMSRMGKCCLNIVYVTPQTVQACSVPATVPDVEIFTWHWRRSATTGDYKHNTSAERKQPWKAKELSTLRTDVTSHQIIWESAAENHCWIHGKTWPV